jgi:hypothetical protein
MRRLSIFIALTCPLWCQQLDLESYIRLLEIAPGASIESKVKALDDLGIRLSQAGVRELLLSSPESGTRSYGSPLYGPPELRSSDGQDKYLGKLSSNPYDPDSVSNPFGVYGSRYSPDSINNPYGPYGSPYSPYSARNPYATAAPAIVTPDGKYLGKFSANRFDPDSVSNPFGRYGSPFSPDSINNPFGPYGSPFSPQSVRNPYAPAMPAAPRLPALPGWSHRLLPPIR